MDSLHPEEHGRLSRFKSVLNLRSKTMQAARRFFQERHFLEVETPVLVATPALELHIDAYQADGSFLRTSPELHMKRLLASGYGRIFQVGPCFRQGEQGHLHNPEFTMLEWYRAGADYKDLLVDIKVLLAYVAQAVLGQTSLTLAHALSTSAQKTDVEMGEDLDARLELLPDWELLTVSQAFKVFAGWDPVVAFDAERFNLDLVNKVEPALSRRHPVVLIDYPAAAAGLARCKAKDPRVAERWELYLGGVELANACSELTDPGEQRRRFTACREERRRIGKPVYPLDEEFMAMLESGLPPSAGVALGFDRLVMLLSGAASLADVLPFTA